MPKYIALVELMEGRGFSAPIETKESYEIFERIYYWPENLCPEIPTELYGWIVNGDYWDLLTVEPIISIELIPQWENELELVNLSVEDGKKWAEEKDLDFRIIMQDGKSLIQDASIRKNRVNVYTSKGYIYRAERF